MKSIIEGDLNPVPLADLSRQVRLPGLNGEGGFLAGCGGVDVARSQVDPQGGYSWTVTFTSAIGDVPQLEV